MPSTVRNSLLWIFDALERDPTFVHKRMFGCDAAYIDGLMCLIAADRAKPWNGLIVCTSQDRQAALLDEIPALRVHPVIPKWMVITQEDPAFEDAVSTLTTLVLERDPRIGVEPTARKRTRKRNSVLPDDQAT